MKKFVSENWYKLMIGSSLLMASFGFMVYCVSPEMADNNNKKFNLNSNYRLMPTNADGSINVKLSDKQLDRIIPKNEDGSINITLSDKQINKLASVEGQPVPVIIVDWYTNSNSNDGSVAKVSDYKLHITQ